MTNCVCPIAGYCERHRVAKSEHWHTLCQTRENYFQAWESGRGPGQEIQDPRRKEVQRRLAEEAKRKKEESGRAAWDALHSVTNPTPQWYAKWLETIPSFGCGCRDDWDKLTKEYPPDFDNFAQWAIDRHNDVNRKLGKPVWQPPPPSA